MEPINASKEAIEKSAVFFLETRKKNENQNLNWDIWLELRFQH